eukprot:gb/GEZN01007055.1/.p1 GENE.gb/GEZN01007055.1/~~gb/GEZN01007055.1/.p1  ORF type:complete len:350 (+),score=70.86 gb/GEZN01007055.1/:28-1077(+)
MSVAGELYDITSKLLGKIPSEASVELELSSGAVEAQLVEGGLKLKKVTSTDTKAEEHKRVVETVKTELSRRKEDMKALQTELAGLMVRLEDANEESEQVAMDVARVSGVIGTHKKRIKTLEQENKVEVNYVKTNVGEAVTLRPGVLAKVQWHSSPVVWCPQLQVDVVQEKVKITEKLPMEVKIAEQLLMKNFFEFKWTPLGSGITDDGENLKYSSNGHQPATASPGLPLDHPVSLQFTLQLPSLWFMLGISSSPSPPKNSYRAPGTYGWACSGQVYVGGVNKPSMGGWVGFPTAKCGVTLKYDPREGKLELIVDTMPQSFVLDIPKQTQFYLHANFHQPDTTLRYRQKH